MNKTNPKIVGSKDDYDDFIRVVGLLEVGFNQTIDKVLRKEYENGNTERTIGCALTALCGTIYKVAIAAELPLEHVKRIIDPMLEELRRYRNENQ